MQPIITPEDYLAYLREQGIPPTALAVAKVAVFAWGPLCEGLVRLTGARRKRDWMYDRDWPQYLADQDESPVSIFRTPTGASAATLLLEYVIACGGSTVIGLGIAGGIDPAYSIGTVVVVSGALAGEGTSPYYLPALNQETSIRQAVLDEIGGALTTKASPSLVRRIQSAFDRSGVAATSGVAWSTDAPFREMPSRIAAQRQQGAVVVDMETSALYAVASFRDVEICNVVVVSDELWAKWRPGFHLAELHSAQATASSVVARVAREVAAGGRAQDGRV